MAIKDIIGQDRALRILFSTLKRNMVPSAFLFSGDSGIGKKTAAINYAKALNCLEPADFDCCDKCISCKKIDSALHPDVLVITLENLEETLSLKAKEGKDKNRYEFPIEAVRKIEEILYLRPYEGKKKVVIVDDADTMNEEAASAFLKTLEEPSPDSLIILISSNPDRLLDTIRSRCINVRFYPLSLKGCEEVIVRKLDAKNTGFILSLSMGSPGLAISRDFIKEREWFKKLLDNMIRGESKITWADKSEIRSWLDMATVFLRDIAVGLELGAKNSESLLFPGVAVLKPGTRNPELKTILEAYQDMQQIRGFLDFNLNKSITWNYVSSIMRTLMAHSS